jgi:hypothetical protein
MLQDSVQRIITEKSHPKLLASGNPATGSLNLVQ